MKLIKLTSLILLALLITANAENISASELSSPAVFVEMLQLPGEGNQLLKPSELYFDYNFDELYVLDKGHNRILIFDSLGNYRFEFFSEGRFSAPTDIAVDSKGFIYILANDGPVSTIFKYDFDGLFISAIDFSSISKNNNYIIRNITIDENDHLFIYEHHSKNIFELSENGELITQFAILGNDRKINRDELIIGSIYASDDHIYIPFSNLGSVYKFSKSGELVAVFGTKGSLPGQFSFPQSITINKDLGMLFVVDKHRFIVSCYTLEGKFLGEFGGKGFREGWFYYPTMLAADDLGNIYVGQLFNNMVQKCAIPEWIMSKINKQNMDKATADSSNEPVFSNK